jgi:hypothetical protein
MVTVGKEGPVIAKEDNQCPVVDPALFESIKYDAERVIEFLYRVAIEPLTTPAAEGG